MYKTGIWIDRKQAVIVTLENGNAVKTVIKSNVDSQLSRTDGVKSNEKFESRKIQPDDIQSRAYAGHLAKYYEEVIKAIEKATSIYIFGPGEAKTELNRKLCEMKKDGSVAEVDTTDKMTDAQIISHVKDFYKSKG